MSKTLIILELDEEESSFWNDLVELTKPTTLPKEEFARTVFKTGMAKYAEGYMEHKKRELLRGLHNLDGSIGIVIVEKKIVGPKPSEEKEGQSEGTRENREGNPKENPEV